MLNTFRTLSLDDGVIDDDKRGAPTRLAQTGIEADPFVGTSGPAFIFF